MAACEPVVAFGRKIPAPVSLEDLVGTFVDSDLPVATATLRVIAALSDDEKLVAQMRAELAGRPVAELPPWVAAIDEVDLVAVLEGGDELGDVTNHVVELRLDSSTLSVVVSVDNNQGGALKDGFGVPLHLPGHVDADPAVLRATVESVLAEDAERPAPLETETWPSAGPLVRWALRMLPEGGEVPAAQEWTDQQTAELIELFMRSTWGTGLDDVDHRALLQTLIWFGKSAAGGDVMRWSPVKVEMLMNDWMPHKVVADVGYLTKMPRLLRALIRYCHGLRSISAAGTSLTLAAVDRWELDYRALINSGRDRDPEVVAQLVIEQLEAERKEQSPGL